MSNLFEVKKNPDLIDRSVIEDIKTEIEQHRRKTQSIDNYDLVGDCLDIIDRHIKAPEQETFDEYGNYKYPSDIELTEPNMPTSTPCEDAISREDLIQKFYDDVFIRDKTDSKEDYQQVFASTVLAVIEHMPSVTPKRKVGEWKKNERTFWTCSECGLVNKYNRVQYAYCPNCGAKMESEEKDG